MELQGYKPYESNTPRQITSKDKFLLVKDGHERVITVLLTRRKNLICRREGEQGKFEMFFTTWTQEDGMPMIYGGGQLSLWVPVDAPAADVKPTVKRVKPAAGESKIAKCRAIFAAAPAGASKEDIIAKFVSDAGCTPAGAVTYYITCRKG